LCAADGGLADAGVPFVGQKAPFIGQRGYFVEMDLLQPQNAASL
jgi:hypothetical protein